MTYRSEQVWNRSTHRYPQLQIRWKLTAVGVAATAIEVHPDLVARSVDQSARVFVNGESVEPARVAGGGVRPG